MTLTALQLLDIYRMGSFPMADSGQDDEFYIVTPHMRGLLPIDPLRVPKRLARTVRQNPYRVQFNTCFRDVIDSCAAETAVRASTWINPPIRNLFYELHDMGYAHSVECFEGDDLVGGLYGLAFGQVFCGESMFSRKKDASKIALVHLAHHLHQRGFQMLDAQFTNPHLEQFGLIEISQEDYLRRLHYLMVQPAQF